MWIIAAGIVGFFIDCIFGDPLSIPHPVRLIGWWISALEKFFRRVFPKTPVGERIAGAVMTIMVLLLTGIPTALLLWIFMKINFWLGFFAGSIISWQVVAAKCLKTEALKVQRVLEKNDLNMARKQVSMLVGRDTDNLDATGISKAAIETVAENTSDGVVAPIFWLMVGGPVVGLLYKAINTMDSMVGYKNERYLYFGTFAAKLDDIVNYLPARLSAVFMITSAFILKLDGKNAWRIWKRDKRKHASPNSAQTEAVCAGALNIQLAGDASYFGKIHKKPYIGDPNRSVETKDIKNSCYLMYGTSLISLAVFSLIRYIIIML